MWFYGRSGATIKHRHNCKIWQREKLKLQSGSRKRDMLTMEVEIECLWREAALVMYKRFFWQMRVKIETRNCNYVTLQRTVASPYKSWDLDDKLTLTFFVSQNIYTKIYITIAGSAVNAATTHETCLKIRRYTSQANSSGSNCIKKWIIHLIPAQGDQHRSSALMAYEFVLKRIHKTLLSIWRHNK